MQKENSPVCFYYPHLLFHTAAMKVHPGVTVQFGTVGASFLPLSFLFCHSFSALLIQELPSALCLSYPTAKGTVTFLPALSTLFQELAGGL